jgi:hypothetical protein
MTNDDGLEGIRRLIAAREANRPLTTDEEWIVEDAGYWKHQTLKARLENTCRSAAANVHASEKARMKAEIENLKAKITAMGANAECPT